MDTKVTPIICGLSGTFKSTVAKIKFGDRQFIESPTKYVLDFDKNYLNYDAKFSSVTSLLLRMRLIEEYKNNPLVVERSIYDYFYYEINNPKSDFKRLFDFDHDILDKKEEELLGVRDYYLMINKAHHFIETKILNDPLRPSPYETVSNYLEAQDRYIEFLEPCLVDFKYTIITDEDIPHLLNNNLSSLTWITLT